MPGRTAERPIRVSALVRAGDHQRRTGQLSGPGSRITLHVAHTPPAYRLHAAGVSSESREDGHAPPAGCAVPGDRQAVPALATSSRHLPVQDVTGDEGRAASGPGTVSATSGHRRSPAAAEERGQPCDVHTRRHCAPIAAGTHWAEAPDSGYRRGMRRIGAVPVDIDGVLTVSWQPLPGAVAALGGCVRPDSWEFLTRPAGTCPALSPHASGTPDHVLGSFADLPALLDQRP
jgi:hypothetical protein